MRDLVIPIRTTFVLIIFGLSQVSAKSNIIENYLETNTQKTIVFNSTNSFIIYGCKDAEIFLDESGHAHVSPHQVVNGPIYSDPAVSLSQYNFNCDHVGINEVTVTTSSMGGGSSSCIANVTVMDSIPPTPICQDLNLTLNETGTSIITFQHLDNGSFDNCDFSSISLSQNEFTEENVGTNQVTITIIDSNGNVGTCQSQVILSTYPSNDPLDIMAAFDYPSVDDMDIDDINIFVQEKRLPAIDLSMTLYPNPNFHGETTLVLKDMNQGNKLVSIDVYNSMGATIYQTKTVLNETDAKLKLGLKNDLPSGIYSVLVTIGNNRLSERLAIRN